MLGRCGRWWLEGSSVNLLKKCALVGEGERQVKVGQQDRQKISEKES